MKKLLLILLCLPFIGVGQLQNRWGEENKCVSGNCINGSGKLIYWVDGMVDAAESTYSGYFKDGKFNGKGEIFCHLGGFEGDAGDYYIIGNWKDGKLHGDAITYDRSQSYMYGDLFDVEDGDTLWDGFGSTYTTLLQETIIKHSGQYEDSLLNGFGLMTINSFRYIDDDIYDETYTEMYIGKWKNGMKHGFGRYIYKNGNIYEGEWTNDKIEGRGRMIYNDGSIKDGIWEDDKYIGK
tara:strand:- start:47 stop:757 length:711 start_codon:yes stop_codon:yes gene_type:complete